MDSSNKVISGCLMGAHGQALARPLARPLLLLQSAHARSACSSGLRLREDKKCGHDSHCGFQIVCDQIRGKYPQFAMCFGGLFCLLFKNQ